MSSLFEPPEKFFQISSNLAGLRKFFRMFFEEFPSKDFLRKSLFLGADPPPPMVRLAGSKRDRTLRGFLVFSVRCRRKLSEPAGICQNLSEPGKIRRNLQVPARTCRNLNHFFHTGVKNNVRREKQWGAFPPDPGGFASKVGPAACRGTKILRIPLKTKEILRGRLGVRVEPGLSPG